MNANLFTLVYIHMIAFNNWIHNLNTGKPKVRNYGPGQSSLGFEDSEITYHLKQVV